MNKRKVRRDNELLVESLIAQKATEKRCNIIPNKPVKASKLNIRGLL